MEIQRLSSVQDLRLQHQIQPGKDSGADFTALFREEASRAGVQFSKHAAERMTQRGVELTPDLAEGLKEAVSKARSKGAKDVAVIGPQSAFIVNVTNNTVITTMNAQEMKSNIFTNIDSAVII